MEQFMTHQKMSVVSPYIDSFNLFPKAKRVNVAPAYDPEAMYHNITGLTPTEVKLGDAPKMMGCKKKYPTSYPITNNLYPGDGKVPLYGNQVRDTNVPNNNHWYASEFKNTKLKSEWDIEVDKYFGKQDMESYNRHIHPSKEVGEYSMEETTHQKLERLIRNL